MSVDTRILLAILFLVVIVGLAAWATIHDKREYTERRMKLLSDLEMENLQPKCRIKVVTQRGVFYTREVPACILFKSVHSSKIMTDWRLKSFMKDGYVAIIDGGVTLHVPLCNVLSAEVIDYEPSV